MKLACLSESPADEAALRILVEAILGCTTESVPLSLRSRGWPAVRQALPAVLSRLYYETDAEGIVAVVDANHSPIHTTDHESKRADAAVCRLCLLREDSDRTSARFGPRPSGGPFRVALGLAVPALEAWYLCGRDPNVTEEAWREGMETGKYPYRKNGLKAKVYDTDRPSLALEKERAAAEASRLSSPEMLASLEARHPGGFGTMAAELRAWRA